MPSEQSINDLADAIRANTGALQEVARKMEEMVQANNSPGVNAAAGSIASLLPSGQDGGGLQSFAKNAAISAAASKIGGPLAGVLAKGLTEIADKVGASVKDGFAQKSSREQSARIDKPLQQAEDVISDLRSKGFDISKEEAQRITNQIQNQSVRSLRARQETEEDLSKVPLLRRATNTFSRWWTDTSAKAQFFFRDDLKENVLADDDQAYNSQHRGIQNSRQYREQQRRLNSNWQANTE